MGLMEKAGATALETLGGMALGQFNDARQLRQQKKLSEQQGLISNKYAMDLWEKTNYSAQRKQLEKAGLNVGLMYKGAGEGGRTGAPVAGGNAPTGGGEVGMALQTGIQKELLQAQKENIEADTKLKETEANKKGGADTENVQANTAKLIQETLS